MSISEDVIQAIMGAKTISIEERLAIIERLTESKTKPEAKPKVLTFDELKALPKIAPKKQSQKKNRRQDLFQEIYERIAEKTKITRLSSIWSSSRWGQKSNTNNIKGKFLTFLKEKESTEGKIVIKKERFKGQGHEQYIIYPKHAGVISTINKSHTDAIADQGKEDRRKFRSAYMSQKTKEYMAKGHQYLAAAMLANKDYGAYTKANPDWQKRSLLM